MNRYQNIDTKKRWDGKIVYKTVQYPKIYPSDTDYIINASTGDYLDTLAKKFYNDSSLWWIIALVNNIGNGRLSVEEGKELRIPVNIKFIIDEYTRINKE